jgi:hypothetical protein
VQEFRDTHPLLTTAVTSRFPEYGGLDVRRPRIPELEGIE